MALTAPGVAVTPCTFSRETAVTLSDQDKQRIAKEEETWNAPRLFVLGFVFLGACITVIMIMSRL